MLEDDKIIKAKDIIEDPASIHGLLYAHIILTDNISLNGSFKHLMPAIEILWQAGWEVITFQYVGAAYVMMRNSNAKRKNG